MVDAYEERDLVLVPHCGGWHVDTCARRLRWEFEWLMLWIEELMVREWWAGKEAEKVLVAGVCYDIC